MSVHVLCIDEKTPVLADLLRAFHAYHEEWTMAFVLSVEEGRISILPTLTRFFTRSGRFAAYSVACPIMRTQCKGGNTP